MVNNLQTSDRILHALKGDKVIWFVVIMLSLFSLLAVYSSAGSMAHTKMDGNTESPLIRHAVIMAFGFLVIFWVHRQHYMKFSRIAPWLYMIALPLLAYTLLFGTSINEARRWIRIPIIDLSFQTSDFAEIAIIIYLARAIATKQENIKDFHSAFLPLILPVVFICGLIAPANLSTAMILFATCVTMMFVGRVKTKYIVSLVGLGVLLLAFLMFLGHYFPDHIRATTWATRFNDFLFSSDSGYQVQQSKIAIAQGGWTGLGPGNSVQRNFLPYPYADFIYAIIWEEYGAIGGFLIISLYVLLFVRSVRLATRSPKTFGAMLVMGLSLLLVIQALANLAVSVNLVPVTGLTLPLVSMGGTSMLFSCISIGMILSVSKYIEKVQLEKEMETEPQPVQATN